jgi:hypothetical protein
MVTAVEHEPSAHPTKRKAEDEDENEDEDPDVHRDCRLTPHAVRKREALGACLP